MQPHLHAKVPDLVRHVISACCHEEGCQIPGHCGLFTALLCKLWAAVGDHKIVVAGVGAPQALWRFNYKMKGPAWTQLMLGCSDAIRKVLQPLLCCA